MAWIDLSRPIVDGMSVYPGDPLFQTRTFADHETDGFRGSELTVGTHLGTHLDAPFHYFIDGETLDSFPLDYFFGDAVILDYTPLVGAESERFAVRSTGRPAAIYADDLEPFEPIIEKVPFLFLRTGWSARWGECDYYTDFPSLSVDACDWLDDFANLRLIGLETPSLVSFPQTERDESSESGDKRRDPFNEEFAEFLPDKKKEKKRKPTLKKADYSPKERLPLDELELDADAECHRTLLGRRPPILILEGLVNLDALPSYTLDDVKRGPARLTPEKTLEAACPPLPIVGVDGCPVRAAAQVKRPAFNVVG